MRSPLSRPPLSRSARGTLPTIRRAAALGAALLVTTAALAGCDSAGDSDDGSDAAALDRTVANTEYGALRGDLTGTHRSFLGVPYAAPPVGPLRWKPPAAPAKWRGERDATKAGGFCAQAGSAVSGGSSGAGGTNEDCLYLNVHTPTAATARRAHAETDLAKLPVMVWIHGGSYTSGAGSDYGPARLVSEGGVIVVTINYRLGPLGFLAHPALTGETDLGSGTYGILDQQAALRWVRNNIGGFGGDPKNVTIFGESAGGSSVCSQLTSPKAEGLFAKAIAQSGCALRGPTQDVAERTGQTLAARLGCRGATTAVLTCLRSRTAAQVLDASKDVVSTNLTYAPATGNAVLPLDVESAFKAGKFTKVPLLQGTNHDEGRLFVVSAGSQNLSAAAYPQAIRQTVGAELAPRILAEYPLSAFGGSAPDALGAIITDTTFACPALRTNRLVAAHAPVHAYEFNDPAAPLPAIPGYPLKAAHAAELPYLFDLERLGSLPGTAEQLSREMLGYWTSFARSGTPTATDAAAWPRFTADGQLQNLVPGGSKPADVAAFATDHHCDFWAGIPRVALRR